jgi:thiol-disulfide isomerase/thioredoxin
MSRQWLFVLTVLAGLGLAMGALVWFGPDVQAVEAGAKAPDYRVVDIASGDSVSLRQHYAGKVTLVNIWATWCVPCRVEMPAMERLYDSLGAQGFRIAAVSIDADGPGPVQEFVKELGLTFDILQDQSGRIQQVYQTTGVPESFLLDKDGIIIKRVIGAHDWSSQVNTGLVRRLMGDTTAMVGTPVTNQTR